ncbi:hypothetical protein ACLKA6_015906 [Drosophila palustris]
MHRRIWVNAKGDRPLTRDCVGEAGIATADFFGKRNVVWKLERRRYECRYVKYDQLANARCIREKQHAVDCNR